MKSLIKFQTVNTDFLFKDEKIKLKMKERLKKALDCLSSNRINSDTFSQILDGIFIPIKINFFLLYYLLRPITIEFQVFFLRKIFKTFAFTKKIKLHLRNEYEKKSLYAWSSYINDLQVSNFLDYKETKIKLKHVEEYIEYSIWNTFDK